MKKRHQEAFRALACTMWVARWAPPALLVAAPVPHLAATIVVDETAAAPCTLVDAMTAAKFDAVTGNCTAGSGPDVIWLDSNVHLTESQGTIDRGYVGLVTVNSRITIEGAGHAIVRADEAPPFGIFGVETGGELTLNDLTVRNGWGEFGGVVYNAGSLSINRSTFLENRAYGGGALWNQGGTVFVRQSTFLGNTADNTGGAISHFPPGTFNVSNSTLSGNAAEYGGGIFNLGTITLTNVSIVANSADLGEGGGIQNNYGSITMTASLIANSAGYNCANPHDGGVLEGAGNVADDGSCPATQVVRGTLVEPDVRPNGGPTLTHALLPGSAAVDAAGACGLTKDQRGLPRVDGACDSGAFEESASGLVAISMDRNTLTWSSAPTALHFDLVRGDLAALIGSGGDYLAATDACLANDHETAALSHPLDPASGQGFWFLVRAATGEDDGSYDSGGAGQVAGRDDAIATSANGCPGGD